MPYLTGTNYVMGQEGFCTFYSDQIFSIDYEHMTQDEIFKQVLQYNILLSVLPYAAMFLVLAVGTIATSCSKSSGKSNFKSSVNAGQSVIGMLVSSHKSIIPPRGMLMSLSSIL